MQEGFDAEVSALYAKELGVTLEFVPLEVANRIPALIHGSGAAQLTLRLR